MAQSLHPMLNIAVKAARAAGSVINRGALDLDVLKIGRKGPNDFVTEVDRAAEKAVIDLILEAYPDHGILAEESGREHGSQTSEYLWIIDPLDGTTNFLHGFPQYAVSIALAHRGVVQQAVVYDPARNDMFFASRGKGAFLNDRRLRVSKRTRLGDCLIGTGFPFRKGDNFKRYMKMFEEVMQSCAGLRRPGAAALDLCYVAAGWYDGFFETGLSPWDVAAGSLMITEAGGLIGNFTGESDYLYQREVLAATPRIYGQLVQMLAPHSRVIEAAAGAAGAGLGTSHGTAYGAPIGSEEDATQVFASGSTAPTEPIKPAPRRIMRKPELPAPSTVPVTFREPRSAPPRAGSRRPPVGGSEGASRDDRGERGGRGDGGNSGGGNRPPSGRPTTGRPPSGRPSGPRPGKPPARGGRGPSR